MDLTAFRQTAVSGLKPGKPLQNPVLAMRAAVGMLVATLAGVALGSHGHQTLVIVGAPARSTRRAR